MNYYEVAIPMVCFCDIPLSQIRNHVNLYGNYGIGLSKQWGMGKRISPILYTYEQSKVSSILSSMKYDFSNQRKKSLLTSNIESNFYDFIKFCKPYKGKMWKNARYTDNITFYNEREWRYVPDNFDIANKEQYEAFSEEYNRDLEKAPLIFSSSDIKYLFVKGEDDINKIIDHIKKHRKKYTNYERLYTKILTINQIKDDF